jgi:hypothetical protein
LNNSAPLLSMRLPRDVLLPHCQSTQLTITLKPSSVACLFRFAPAPGIKLCAQMLLSSVFQFYS